MSVGVVADDLTGAHDAAVQFASRGWSTLLDLRGVGGEAGPDAARRDGSEARGSDVVAIITDARAFGEESAAVTRRAVDGLMVRGVERLYVKIDSTMRGSVHRQVRGALAAWSRRHAGAVAVICPAYPAMGRTVVDGSVLVHELPAELGAAGEDPVTPLTTSRLADLLPGSVHVSGRGDGDAVRLAGELARHSERLSVLTVDASTDEHLEVLAEALAQLGPRVVPVGSAGLAAAMAHRWARLRAAAPADLGHVGEAPTPVWGPLSLPAPGPVLVLVTSPHPTSQQQVQHLLRHRDGALWHLAPSLADLVDDASLSAWWQRARPPAASREVVLVTAPARDGEPGAAAGPRSLARRLALAAELARGSAGAAAVVVVGGDGARALLDLWGCHGIAVRGAVAEGVPHGVVVGGTVHGLPVLTKSGGFGRVDALTVAVEHAVHAAQDAVLAAMAPPSQRTGAPTREGGGGRQAPNDVRGEVSG